MLREQYNQIMMITVLLFFGIFGCFHNMAHGHCLPSQFECDNGNCIDSDELCNYIDDCGDNSDERRHVTGFKCPMGHSGNVCVLPQRLVNDSVAQCNDESDYCVMNNVKRCHKCLTVDLLLGSSQLCDGVIDCPDLSDECLCESTDSQFLCEQLKPGQMLACDQSKLLPVTSVCDGVNDCDDLLDERFCRYLQGRDLRSICYGVCEEKCSTKSVFCSLSSPNTSTTCLLDQSFSNKAVCDAAITNCSESMESECSLQFHCSSNQSKKIDLTQVCNGYPDCADGSDESECPNLEPCSGYPDCEDKGPKFCCRFRYNCSSPLPISVPESYISDGIDDCSDGSDECPDFLDNKFFSSKHQLIKHLVFTVSLWAIALFGAIGNATVFSHTLCRLTKRGSLSLIEKTNLTLILNLNIADFLTSIYLLFIGSTAIKYSGVYCKFYLAWRTSLQCTIIGSIAVLSAEASLLVLTLMTTQRLYSACHPFNNGIGMRWIAMGIVVVWILSILTAIMPSLLPQVFYERYWIASKYFNQPLVRPNVFDKFFLNLVYLTQSANFSSLASRVDQQKFLADNFPQLKVLGNFGYYSENAVCIPHLYPPVGDNGWLYPTIIVTFNMAIFVYVVIAYCIIYRVSTKNSNGTEKSLITHQLQKRIAKLVAVNFAVWFSIGILSYVQLGLAEEFPEVLYDVTGIVIFPLNSVINPLLYSDVFENFFFKIYKTLIGCIKPNKSGSSCVGAQA